MPGPVRFWGRVLGVRPRLTLAKFDGETEATCAGYVLTVDGTRAEGNDAAVPATVTVAIGRATLLEKKLKVGDLVRGDAYPVPDTTPDVLADLYRVGVLRVIAPASAPPPLDPPRSDNPLPPDGVEKARRRALAPQNLAPDGPCVRCPYGVVVCTVVLEDPRNPRRGQWHRVPACLGPDDCPHYRRP